ncbi:MAG TPA: hypothetical protein ACHBYY_13175, partial [Arsenophonus nasoniae]
GFSRYFPCAKNPPPFDCKTLTSLLNLLRHLTAMSAKSAIHIAHLLLAFIGLINICPHRCYFISDGIFILPADY